MMTKQAQRNLTVAAISAFVVALIALLVNFLHHPFRGAHDSPVEIAGGSVHICSSKEIDYDEKHQIWTAHLDKGIDAKSVDFSDVASPPATSGLGASWTMYLGDSPDPGGPSQTPTGPIIVTSKGDGSIQVALTPTAGSLTGAFQDNKHTVVVFKDAVKCKADPENPSCVHIHHVALNGVRSGECKVTSGIHSCGIYIGPDITGSAGKNCSSTIHHH